MMRQECTWEGEGKELVYSVHLPANEALMMYAILLQAQKIGEHQRERVKDDPDASFNATVNLGRINDIRADMRRAFARTLPNFKMIETMEQHING